MPVGMPLDTFRGILMHRRGVKQKGKGFGKMMTYPATLCFRSTGTGAVSTFYAPVISLTPQNISLVTEAQQWGALFDEARCTKIDVYCRIEAVNGNGAWGFAYDPANSSAYTSVVGILLSDQHVCPVALNASTATSSAMQVTSATGYKKLKVRVPPVAPTASSGAPNESVGNNWFATSDQSANVGFIKLAVDGFGGLAPVYDVMVKFYMEYRSRS